MTKPEFENLESGCQAGRTVIRQVHILTPERDAFDAPGESLKLCFSVAGGVICEADVRRNPPHAGLTRSLAAFVASEEVIMHREQEGDLFTFARECPANKRVKLRDTRFKPFVYAAGPNYPYGPIPAC